MNVKPKSTGTDLNSQGAYVPISEENVMKIKINFLGKMMKMYKTLREENELILRLKGLCNTRRLPRGILLEGKSAIIDAIEEYGNAKNLDKGSEKRPTLVAKKK